MGFKLTLEELAQNVNCEEFPERWNTFFEEVKEDFDKNGCLYTKPEYYDNLNQKYGVLDSYLDLYKKAALEVGKDENLSLFLAVICRALQDRDFHESDLEHFSIPKKEGDFAYEMLTALAMASEVEMCYNLIKERNLPPESIREVLRLPEDGITSFMNRHEGRPGFCLLWWFQLAVDGKLFRIKRLEFEIFSEFEGRACIFRNKKGQEVALAHNITLHKSGNALGSVHFEDKSGSWASNITETDLYWEGNPLNDKGVVEKYVIRLKKADWEKVLSPGDPVISIHIPPIGSLSPQLIDETIEEAKNFFQTYYPDYHYKAFVCYSWLMDPQLVDLLGEGANISKFCNRFQKITAKSDGTSVFNFVFLKPDMNFSISELPENTSLERALKNHYLNNKAIYGITGYFF